MGLKIDLLDPKLLGLIGSALKWGALIGVVLGVVYFIKDAGKQEEINKGLSQSVKVLEKKDEVKTEVHKTIGRVSSDPEYHKRVRKRFEGPEF